LAIPRQPLLRNIRADIRGKREIARAALVVEKFSA